MIRLVLIFLKIGFLGFGGGYAMLSLIWNDASNLGISAQQFADLNTLDLLAPGPIAVNSATYVGFITFGIIGAILATLVVCSSSFILSTIYLRYEELILNNKLFSTILEYAKIAAVGMVIAVAVSLTKESLIDTQTPILSFSAILLTCCLRVKTKISTIPCLFIVAAFGALSYLIL